MTIPIWLLVLIITGSMLVGAFLAGWVVIRLIDRSAVGEILFRR